MTTWHLARRHTVALATAGMLAATALATAASSAHADASCPLGAQSFSYTGAEQTYCVPAGVTAVRVTAVGAPGGPGQFASASMGANVTAVVPLPADTSTLYVEVGGAGVGDFHANAAGPHAGGFNGGGNSGDGGSGGGASDVRTTSMATVADSALTGDNDSRLVVAGGAGGADFCCNFAGGSGAMTPGAGDGGSGAADSFSSGGAGVTGGLGGDSGGAAGASFSATCSTSPGARGVGGDTGGACRSGANDESGAGGGGYFGGGAGGDSDFGDGAGGGGSSFWVDAATDSSVSTDVSGVPQVVITPIVAVVDVTGTATYGDVSSSDASFVDAGESGPDAGNLTGALTGCQTSVPWTAGAGTYQSMITACGGLSSPDGDVDYVDGGFTVTPAPLSVIPNSAGDSVFYGTELTSDDLQPRYDGFTDFDDESVVVSDATCSLPAGTASTPAIGDYAITCSGGDAGPNYTFAYPTDAVVHVVPEPLDVFAPDASVGYGDALPTSYEPEYDGLVAGDSAPSTPATCSVEGSPGPVGDYPVTCSGAADPNYDISYYDGNLEIDPAQMTVVAPKPITRYGDPVPALSPTYVGLTNNDTAPATPATCLTSATPRNVGVYDITCDGAADPNYQIATQPGALTVLPAPMLVSAPSATINYGQPVPALAPTYSRFVGGDTVASLSSPATCTVDDGGVATPAPGTYPVTCSGAVASNYDVIYAPSTLTVQPATVRVQAPVRAITYGDSLPDLTPTYSGLSAGLTLAHAATCTVGDGGVAVPGVGSYPIICSGASDPNTVIDYVDGTLLVVKAPLTVVAPTNTVAAGQTLPTSYVATYVGLVRGDTAPTVPATCSVSGTPANVGSYPVTCSGAADPNYSIGYQTGALSIVASSPTSATPTLTVVAPSRTIEYGQAVPATLTATYAGLREGDSAPATAATCTVLAPARPGVGTYPITCSGAADPSYTINYQSGTLNVLPVDLFVAPRTTTIVFRQPGFPSIAPQYVGFLNGDSASTLDKRPYCTTAQKVTHGGVYRRICFGGHDANYRFVYVSSYGRFVQAPAFTTRNRVRVAAMHAFRLRVRTAGYPVATVTARHLPTGWHLRARSAGAAMLTGPAVKAGLYKVRLVAASTAGRTKQLLTIRVR